MSIRKILLILLFIPLFTNYLSAQSEWNGKWQTEVEEHELAKTFYEFDIKNDTVMYFNMITYDSTMYGRFIAKISIKGECSMSGSLFFTYLNAKTLTVSLLKKELINISESQLTNELRKVVKEKLNNIDGTLQWAFIEHDNDPNTKTLMNINDASFKFEVHRPKNSAENILGWEDRKDIKISAADCPDEETVAEPQTTYHKSRELPVESETKKEHTYFGFFISLALYLLYLLVAFLVVIYSKFLFSRRIKRENTAQESVRIRGIYSSIRILLGIVIIVPGLYFWGYLVVDAVHINRFVAMTAICSGGLMLYVLSMLSLPVHLMTMDIFVKKERKFVLYLRGIISDDYTPSMDRIAESVTNAAPWDRINKETERDPNELLLNEKFLADSWEKYFKAYCIGIVEELDSPEGFSRIYLDHQTYDDGVIRKTWKDDVLYLMKKAQYILVCVYNTENCIWEINQCNTLYPEKTIYYIDDIERLHSVKDMMGDKLPVCLDSTHINRNHMVVYMKNNDLIIKPYTNDKDGLEIIADQFMDKDNFSDTVFTHKLEK